MQACRDFSNQQPYNCEGLMLLLLVQPNPIEILEALKSKDEIHAFIQDTKIIEAAYLWLDYLDEHLEEYNHRDILLGMIMNSCWTRKAISSEIVFLQNKPYIKIHPLYMDNLIINLQAIDEFWASLAKHKCFDSFFAELMRDYESYLEKPTSTFNTRMIPEFYLAKFHASFSEMKYIREDIYTGSDFMDSVCSCFTDKEQAAQFIAIIQAQRLVKIKAIRAS